MNTKLKTSICQLHIKEPFYGIIMSQLTIEPSNTTPTAAVYADFNTIHMVYNEDFINKLSTEEIASLCIHECGHIINMHIARTNQEMERFAIGCEMAVNGHAKNPRIGFHKNGETFVPPGGIYAPPNWPDDLTAEEYAEKLPTCPTCKCPMIPGQKFPQTDNNQGGGEGEEDQEKKNQKEEGGGGNKKGKEKEGDEEKEDQGGGGNKKEKEDQGGGGNKKGKEDQKTCPACNRRRNVMVTLDDHSVWNKKAVNSEHIRQIVKGMVEEAVRHAPPGSTPGNIKEILENLNKSAINYRQILKRFIRRHAGKTRLTFSRPNRRFDESWLKGISHRAAAMIGVIVDTSGSISTNDLQQFFGEIEAVASKAKIWVLQYDCEPQDLTLRYRKGDWKKIEIKGRGGTHMGEALQHVIKKKLPADAILVLTDGQTDWCPQIPIPTIICLTEDNECPKWAEKILIKQM